MPDFFLDWPNFILFLMNLLQDCVLISVILADH